MGGQALRRSLFHCLNRSPTRTEPSRRNPRCSDLAEQARFHLIIAPKGCDQLQICLQLPPLATRPIYIADRVEYLAHVRLALTPSRAGRRNHRFNDRPLFVAEIARITPV